MLSIIAIPLVLALGTISTVRADFSFITTDLVVTDYEVPDHTHLLVDSTACDFQATNFVSYEDKADGQLTKYELTSCNSPPVSTTTFSVVNSTPLTLSKYVTYEYEESYVSESSEGIHDRDYISVFESIVTADSPTVGAMTLAYYEVSHDVAYTKVFSGYKYFGYGYKTIDNSVSTAIDVGIMLGDNHVGTCGDPVTPTILNGWVVSSTFNWQDYTRKTTPTAEAAGSITKILFSEDQYIAEQQAIQEQQEQDANKDKSAAQYIYPTLIFTTTMVVANLCMLFY